jgi:hypothetical protein
MEVAGIYLTGNNYRNFQDDPGEITVASESTDILHSGAATDTASNAHEPVEQEYAMSALIQDPLTSLEDIIQGLVTSKLDLFVGMGHDFARRLGSGNQMLFSRIWGSDSRLFGAGRRWQVTVVLVEVRRACAWRRPIKELPHSRSGASGAGLGVRSELTK